MTMKRLLHGILCCFLLAGVATMAQGQLPADYLAHLKAAKDAARFDWTGVQLTIQ